MKIPFHRAYMGEEEVAAAAEAIRSGWLTMGEKTFLFEKNFAAYTGAAHAVAVNSCTAALHLALKVLGIRPGDEVIIPAMTFIATWEVITYFGARPVPVDIDPVNFCIDVRAAERAITSSTKAIIPVHYGGEACDMDPLLELARRHGLHVVEDAAHALPTSYKKKMVGTIGDITCFSFYATKTITTGEGGMITTHNHELAERIRRLRLHGITKDAWNRYSEKGTWQYDVAEAGYKYNITDIASAIGVEQLKKCDAMNRMRHEIAAAYNHAFETCELLETWGVRDKDECAWHLYPVMLNLDALRIGRDEFIEKLKDAGVGTSVHYIPMYRFSCFDGSGFEAAGFPVCEHVFEREVSLPVYPGMTGAERGHVIDAVLSILEGNRR